MGAAPVLPQDIKQLRRCLHSRLHPRCATSRWSMVCSGPSTDFLQTRAISPGVVRRPLDVCSRTQVRAADIEGDGAARMSPPSTDHSRPEGPSSYGDELPYAEYSRAGVFVLRVKAALLPGRSDGGGVVFALTDVQAEEDVDVADVDHVVVPSVLFTRPCHGTDRHIHITKSLPTSEEVGGHAPNQRSVSAFGAGDTTPRAMHSTRGGSHANSEGRSPRCGTTKTVMGGDRSAAPEDSW